MTHTVPHLLVLVATIIAPAQTAFCQTTVNMSPTHPGNVFLQGETLAIPVAEEDARWWRLEDERDKTLREGTLPKEPPGALVAAELPVGWYRVVFLDGAGKEIGWTTAAVLAPLAVPTPDDSPICVDSATAWFAKDDPARQEQFSRLAELAGVNWIRDRMRWREIEPEEHQFAHDTTYDSSATIEHRHGLKVLQVFHDTPPWAAEGRPRGRFPTDLRHVYRFAKAMSNRFKGRVQAWEPWNESNVSDFGGHTIDEICSYQKAAYLGFKAGDPDVTVCWNATTGVPTERQTDALLLNETWSYFDTYNIHTYDWADSYERLWIPSRRAACGKPLWITESDRGMKSEPPSPTHDLSPVNRRLKAEFLAQSYVQSLHAGSQRHFHFVLGQYGEGETQFGLLRHNLTPRPAYVALAALGRLLAGAQCLGRLVEADTPDLHVYGFRSRPDGERRDVLVAWVEKNVDWPGRGKAKQQWPLPEGITPERCFDYLGREISIGDPVALTSAPIYLVLPEGLCDGLTLTRPELSPRRTDRVSPVVLQCAMPPGTGKKIDRIPWAWEIDYHVAPGTPCRVPLYAYNFSDKPLQGTVELVQLPPGCKAEPTQWNVDLAPMARVELPAQFTIPETMTADKDDLWISLRGNFGGVPPTLTFRLTAEKK